MEKEIKLKENYLDLNLASKKELIRIKKNSNSKDEILLEKQGSEFVIKKTWMDIDRGFQSIKKQIEFDEIRISSLIVRSPTVYLTQKVCENQFVAKMEYIDGNSGSDITKNGSRKVSLSLKNALSMILSKNIENSVLKKINSSIFTSKIDSIISSEYFLDEFKEDILFLRGKFVSQRYIEIPVGPCHGDLTLSNVIVSPTGSLNLIDFLPTFIESPLWDIVKINQDLKYGWSYRYSAGPPNASAKLFFQSCIPTQLDLYKKVWGKQISLINALNLARLTPYIKDSKTKEWVSKNFKKALFELK